MSYLPTPTDQETKVHLEKLISERSHEQIIRQFDNNSSILTTPTASVPMTDRDMIPQPKKSTDIVDIAKNCLTIQNNLKQEEERNIENTLIYLLQNREFESMPAQQRAAILTQKVLAIRNDYT